jgi:hypothetical protein
MSDVAADGDFRRDIDLLRLSVRLLRHENTLPPIGPSRVGRGKGTACAICSAVISDGEVAYHVESDTGSVSVHVTCYLVWRYESEEERAASGLRGEHMSPAEIRSLVRQGLRQGRLWPISYGHVWASAGNSTTHCAVCMTLIEPGHVQYEVRAPSGIELAVHYPCYFIWRDEAVAFAHDGCNCEERKSGPS